MTRLLTIKEVANLYGVSHRTLRFYETRGLLKPVERDTKNRRRMYDKHAAERLGMIRRAVEIGMTLDEIYDHIDPKENRITVPKHVIAEIEKRALEAQRRAEVLMAHAKTLVHSTQQDEEGAVWSTITPSGIGG